MECLNPKSVEGTRLREKNGFTQMCIGNQARQQYPLAVNRSKRKETVEREIISGAHK